MKKTLYAALGLVFILGMLSGCDSMGVNSDAPEVERANNPQFSFDGFLPPSTYRFLRPDSTFLFTTEQDTSGFED